MKRERVVIMGAAGRDFHNFNIFFRDNPCYEVVAFTAAQIPYIENRIYPFELSGPLYPQGIPIYPEERLPSIIRDNDIGLVIFAYSDVSHKYVMQRASLANAHGADFRLLAPERTMLHSKRPVISVCAVRTGCGKSGIVRVIIKLIDTYGKRVVVIRHPMPYGSLALKRVQRFANRNDLAGGGCTIEELEEYEPVVNAGHTVYAGVDCREVLKAAEADADIIVWDGGNNDTPFIKPDLEMVVLDPHRAGDELSYYPGEINLLRADILIINKVNTAKKGDIESVEKNIERSNPSARLIHTASDIIIDNPNRLRNMKVLVIEDGPTLTHGGMSFGAGIIAARKFHARIVEPRPYITGSIKKVLEGYGRLKGLIPALGYSPQQLKDLEDSINRVPCDAVVIATPVDLAKIININKPVIRVDYVVKEVGGQKLKDSIAAFLANIH